MKQTTKRFVSVVAGLMFLVGALLIYLNFIRPAREEILALKTQILSKESFIKTQQSTVTQVEKLIKDYQAEEGQQLQDVVSQMLPLEADIAGALVQVSGILENNGLASTSLSFSISVPRIQVGRGDTRVGAASLVRPLSAIRVSAKFSGTYAKLKEFLTMIETNIRVFNVETVSVAPPRDRRESIYTYTATLVTYFQKDAAQTVAAQNAQSDTE